MGIRSSIGRPRSSATCAVALVAQLLASMTALAGPALATESPPAGSPASPSASDDVLRLRTSDAIATRTVLPAASSDPLRPRDDAAYGVSAGPDGFVVIGRSSGDDAAVWTSPDGVGWQVAWESPSLGDPELSAVAVGGPGAVAVGGVASANGDLRPVVQASRDGTEWQSAQSPGLRPIAPATRTGMTAVTRLHDGSLVAVGWDDRGRWRTETFAAWRSSDGLSWERLSPGRRQPGAAEDVAAFGEGWVAVGEGHVYLSRGGRSWRMASPPGGFERVAASGESLIAATSGTEPSGVWTSGDGVDWRRVEPPGPPGHVVTPVDVAASPDRLAVVGSDCAAEGECLPTIWTSIDGVTWDRTHVPLLDGVEIAAMAVADDAIVVVGGATAWDEKMEAAADVAVAVRVPAQPGSDDPTPVRPIEPWAHPPIVEPRYLERDIAPPGVAATRLADGRVLLVGGEVASDSYSATWTWKARILDPRTGHVERMQGLPAEAAYASATIGPDGRVYLVPGLGGPGPILRWDPRSGRWTPLKARIAGARGPDSTTWLADGRLLIATDDGSLKAFDPRSDELKRVPAPGRPLVLRLATTPDGTTVGISLSRAWRLDPEGGWIAAAANPHLDGMWGGAAQGNAIAALADGRVAVLASGFEGVDPELARTYWADEPDYMEDPVPFALLDVYDPLTDTWATEAMLPGRWEGRDLLELEDGRLLIAGPGLAVIERP